MRSTLQESRRRLEIKINETLQILPKDAFDTLFNYLIKFSISPDVCSLRSLVRSQVKNITHLVVEKLFQSSLDFENISKNAEQMECISNSTDLWLEDHVNDLAASFERQMYDLKLFVQGFELAEKVIKTVQRHKFTSSCVAALTRMKYCKLCAGIIIFQPCKHLCVNTMYGCMADIAELESDFSMLLSHMKSLAVYLETEMSPEVFSENILDGFVNVVRDLKNNEYSWWSKVCLYVILVCVD